MTDDTSNRLWESLVDLAGKLRRGEVDLDDLNREIHKKKSGAAAGGESSGRKEFQKTIEQNSTSVSCKKRKRDQVVANDDRSKGEICTSTPEGKSIKLVVKFKGKVLNPRNNNIQDDSVSGAQKRSETEMKKRILDSGDGVLVIEKNLFQSDVDPNKCRLSLPHGQVSEQFLNMLLQSEVACLDSTSEGIPVTLIGIRGEERAMTLRNWKSNNMYALVGGWKDLCRDNGLKVGQFVQLWCFRSNSQLCFALL
ncbi:hypothetical protein ACS0TY_007904 [Phlomoides rotata]